MVDLELERDALPRPKCPKCQMRMITVPVPAPARFECLRCAHSELKGHH